ncbi:hypothetical protein M9458_044319, partial [Cirrhinus mrigala]
PSTPSSLPEQPSTSSSPTTIYISDSEQESKPTTPSSPQTLPARPDQQASQDVAETHVDASQETQETLSSADP